MKNKKSISWNPNIDSETEDRLNYLRLTPIEKWNYIMSVILLTYPNTNKKVTFKKRIIEWK
ncbi:MAG TPA: hypothetical protein PKL31_15965 [Fulvivirga sp.]|nr:hypothetical protein [Fulvivirga sp.]